MDHIELLYDSWDELYVKVRAAGKEQWVPIDDAEDGKVLWVNGRRYSAETGEAK